MLNSKEKKSNLEMFIKLITGHFNNKEQFEEMQKSGREMRAPRCGRRPASAHSPRW